MLAPAPRMKRIGFIGLGIMGRPMAQNLLKAGYPLRVYNRSGAAAEALVAAGATRAASPKEAAAASDVVITMVTDTPDVEQVLLGAGGVIEGARPGTVVIDMSTISPKATRAIAAKLSGVGVRMLDAPVSGGDKGAREGTLTIMVGGPEEAFEESLPVLQAMGKKVVRMGESGAGQLTKLANQILVAGNMMGVCECLVFAAKTGLDPKKVIDSLSAGAASSWSLVNLGPKAVDGDFAPGFKVKLLQKDLRLVLGSGDEVDASLPNTSLAHQLYNALEAAGGEEEGTQALIKVYQRLSGISPIDS
jgi:3-hydroxyisobutyrate dehydrogenase